MKNERDFCVDEFKRKMEKKQKEFNILQVENSKLYIDFSDCQQRLKLANIKVENAEDSYRRVKARLDSLEN